VTGPRAPSLDSCPAVIRSLLAPQAYPEPERPDRVDLVETHVSWLLFAGRLVYKVKKPVDYGFLDFTTLDQRRFYCHEEVRLNRRLSPDVYLGVVDIVERNGRHAVGGPGRAVEYAVKMRRLPADGWLSAQLRDGRASPPLLRRIARRIAAFHAAAATSDHITQVGGREGVRVNTAENFAQTREYVGVAVTPDTYDRVRAYTEAFLDVRAALFARREAEGRIRDGHGDLHADQICAENGIAFIDCIEFNERFRLGDVAADIAFPAMDVDYHGRPDLAAELVREYVEASGDRGVLELLDFYRCYRAYTRGKVRSFRLRQAGLDAAERREIVAQAARYFHLAASYARGSGPLLLAVAGLMGTGKTTLARRLAPQVDAEVLSSDVVRKELAGVPPDAPRPAAWGEGIYTAEFHRRTYGELHRRAAERLRAGRCVILDASYREAAARRAARDTAREAGAPFLVLEAACPEAVVRERLARRGPGPSDGRLELMDAQRERFEPVRELPEAEHAVIDSSTALDEAACAALRHAFEAWLRP
jgi:hypothetical protein